eukprot:TRINITY_DN11066_c0_g1_i2.p3 TRINITY_DN11066_c0_g1~~TRINITY_DN11066_c0_g1_i2.p3  ORF type:complete len:175 (-),score=20.88 TRINITY_DN11066_c0_g1_i2:341-865(-)
MALMFPNLQSPQLRKILALIALFVISYLFFSGQHTINNYQKHVSVEAGKRSLVTNSMAADSQDQTGVIAVYVTVPDIETGKKIASKLVETKLAACVNIIPGLTSVYWWDGKVNEDPELLLMIKSQRALLSDLTKQVQKLHPYDECEVIATDVIGGSPTYLSWVKDSTKDPKPDL